MEFLLSIKGIDLVCEYSIKGSLLLSLSLFLTFMLRKKSASLRHFLLSLSLISLILLPFFSILKKGWETHLLPSWQTREIIPAISTQHEISKASLDPAEKKNVQKPERSPINMGGSNPALYAKPIADSSSGNILGYFLLGIWSVGFACLLLRTFLGLYRAAKLTQQAKILEDSNWKRLLYRFLEVITLKRRIKLLSHQQVTTPFTWGTIKPVVIMPGESQNWADDLRSTALFHELSHVKRGDFLVMMLARMSCLLYWFNPLSWLAFRALRKEQEKACDELVLKAGIKPSTYAANLLSIKNSGVWKWNPVVAVLGAAGASQFNDRLLAILKQKFNPTEVKMKTKIWLSLTVVLAVILIGMARPSHSKAYAINSISGGNGYHVKNPSPHQDKNQTEDQDKTKSEKPDKKDSQVKQSPEKHIHSITVDEKSGHIEIILGEGDETKKILLEEKPVIILNKDAATDMLTLAHEGKCWTIKKGEKGFLLVEGGKVSLIDEDDKIIKLRRGITIKVKTDEKEEGSKVITVDSPHIVIHKGKRAPQHLTIHIRDEKEDKKTVVVAPHVKMKTVVDLEIKEKMLKEKIEKIQGMVKEIVEQRMDRLEALKDYEEVVSRVENEVIQKRLETIFERISEELESKIDIQTKILKNLEESLEKLSEELEKKSEKLKKIEILIKEKPAHVTVKHKDKVKIIKEEVAPEHEGKEKLIGIIDKDKGLTLIFSTKLEEQQKEAYTEALEKLKSELPEGYEVESTFDEESNTVRLTIKGDDKKEESKETLKKLLKELKEKLTKTQ